MPKRIALKYCGGCNPGFDRVGYFQQIQDAADGLIEWVTLDDGGFDIVFIICGCDTACPAEHMGVNGCRRIVSVRNDRRDPAEVVQDLLGEGKS